MLMSKLKLVLVGMMAITLVGTGGTLATYRALGAEQKTSRQAAPPPAAADQSEKPKPDKPKDEKTKPEERTYGYLGVMLKGDDDNKTVLVHEVFPDSPAAKAGVKANDIVLKVGDKQVKEPSEAVNVIKSLKPGDKLAIHLKRDDKELAMTITLGKWPAELTDDGRPKTKDPPEAKKEPGFLGLILQTDKDKGTVLVQDLYPESPAAKAGCKPDDVILKVDTVDATEAEAVIKQLSKLKEGDKVTLRIKRGDKEMDVTVTAAKRPADFGKM